MSEQDQAEITVLDLSDVEHRVGQPVGGGQLWEAEDLGDRPAHGVTPIRPAYREALA